jgi:hypothetical protein
LRAGPAAPHERSPRAGYGAAALAAGVAVWLVTGRFTRGARWALPVVAAAAVGLYALLRPPVPPGGPGDLGVWAGLAVFVLAPVTLAVGPVHPSWVDDQGDGGPGR